MEKIQSKIKIGEFSEPEDEIMEENIEYEELQEESSEVNLAEKQSQM